jgi:lipoprotein-anchoring transpeptidase ErfK/SrfK
MAHAAPHQYHFLELGIRPRGPLSMTFVLERGAKSGHATVSSSKGRRIGALTAAVVFATLAGSTREAAAWFLFDPPAPAPAPIVAPEREVPKARKPHHKGVDTRAQKTLREKLPEKIAGGLLQIVISIDRQQLTLYSDGVAVAHSTVSTGVTGHPTPTGIFSVIEKQRFHRSNLYSDAPMPYMQRITWSGVALHEGVVPGRPASHGCIRMPAAFARQMWTTTKVGARVLIAHSEVVPVEIVHAKLFTPKPAPNVHPQDVPVAGQPARRVDLRTVKTAAMDDPVVTTDATLRGPVKEPAAKAQTATVANAWSTPMLYAVKLVSGVTTAEAAVGARLADAVSAAGAIGMAKKSTDRVKLVEEMRKSGPISVYVSRKEKKIFVRHKFTPVFEAPVTIADPDAPLGTHLYTALALKDGGTAMRWTAATMPSREQTAVEPIRKRSRKGTRDGAELAAPAPPVVPTAALAALDRIEIAPETLDRIAELLTPGASLIISDQGLGPETGRGTDFIVTTR